MADDRLPPTVPFGKYRGRPVADMLADANYMAWLDGQPWFRERYASLLELHAQAIRRADAADAASRTPVHNRLQGLFLEEAYCRAFCERADGCLEQLRDQCAGRVNVSREETREHSAKCLEAAARNTARAEQHELEPTAWRKMEIERLQQETEECHVRSAQWLAVDQELAGYRCEPRFRATFEHQNVDVSILVTASVPYLRGDPSPRTTAYDDHIEYAIEIKPTVADEYSSVLRQMLRNKSFYLFLDRYEGEGLTQAQFVALFAASGRRVVFKADVDAVVCR